VLQTSLAAGIAAGNFVARNRETAVDRLDETLRACPSRLRFDLGAKMASRRALHA